MGTAFGWDIAAALLLGIGAASAQQAPQEQPTTIDDIIVTARKRSERLIGPDVQHIVAWRYEKGEHPHDIAAGMNLTKAAVRDIVAVYERRATMFFKITRTGK